MKREHRGLISSPLTKFPVQMNCYGTAFVWFVPFYLSQAGVGLPL